MTLYNYQELAEYNRYKSKGLMHTSEHIKKMEKQQEEFDKEQMMVKLPLIIRYTCSDFTRHEHRWKWSAWLCLRIQKLRRRRSD